MHLTRVHAYAPSKGAPLTTLGNKGQLCPARRVPPCRASSSPICAELNFPVTCAGVEVDARIGQDGSFEYWPRGAVGPDRRDPDSCCLRSQPTYLQVPGADIVGATLNGHSAFRLWYCPATISGGHIHRKLRQSGDVGCESVEAAQQAVQLLRRLNCWWGRGSAPALVVYVNPVSGSGKSRSAWRNEVQPILEAAGMQLTVTETRHPGHALEAVQKLELTEEVDAIVCVGGDGSMSEIIQGIFRRPDWRKAVDTPLCLVPGGTGNGMAASGGLWTPATAAHALCKGATRRMDVLSVLQPGRARRYSFLSLTYGLIANVDIGTESLRFLGSLRNQVGAVMEILKAAEYTAHVAVLTSTSPAGQAGNGKGGRGQEVATPHLDSLGDLEQLESLECASLPQGWQLLERTSFSLFVVSVMPWLALDFSLVRSEKVDSGEMTLTSLPGALSRWEGLQAMLKADSGKIDDMPKLQTEKLVAFVIEPIGKGTWLVMDGEVLPYERTFAELHPGLGNLIVAP